MITRQLSLSFDLKLTPSIENFVIGKNAELVESLRNFSSLDRSERFIYIWGCEGAGKSHLLSATAELSRRRSSLQFFFRRNSQIPKWNQGNSSALVIVDDVQYLLPEDQHRLFEWYNELKSNDGALVVAGDSPPARLNLRNELLTRLGWGLVYRVHPLTDEEKHHAMARYGKERGFNLSEEVISYVLKYNSRDLSFLLGILGDLDCYSIETRRKITVPLVKEFFAISDDQRKHLPDIF